MPRHPPKCALVSWIESFRQLHQDGRVRHECHQPDVEEREREGINCFASDDGI